MSIKEVGILFLLGMSIISCSKDPSELKFLNLEGEFIVSADQVLTESGPKFGYKVTTINEQDCQSSNIIYRLIDVEGEINLILEDITEIEDCPSESGLISQSIPLNISNVNTEVAISLRNVVKNTGTIRTTAAQYLLLIENPEGIILGNSVVNKLPQDVLFGTIYNSSQDGVDSELIENLNALSDMSLLNGFFTTNFSVINNKAEVIDEAPLSVAHEDFYFRPNNKEEFIETMAELKLNNPSYSFHFVDASNGAKIEF